VGSVEIDRMRPPIPEIDEGAPPVRLLRRGRYLYMASPFHLTTVDIGVAGRPAVTSQVAVRPKVSFLYAFPRPMAWQGDRLFEIRFFPLSLGSYDLRDPAHPAAKGELTFHDAAMTIAGTGRRMYLPWRDGIMEFRAEDDALEASRYLIGEGGTVSAMAVTRDFVYALTRSEERKRERVEAFRVK
jgi:hypothetical protein